MEPSLLHTGAGPPQEAAAAVVLDDLRLSAVIARLCDGFGKYRLAELYSAPLTDPAQIAYRREVAAELGGGELRAAAWAYVRGLAEVEELLKLAANSDSPASGDAWFAAAAQRFLEVLRDFAAALEPARAEGLSRLQEHLQRLLTAPELAALEEAAGLLVEVDRLDFAFLVQGDRVLVQPRSSAPDLDRAILETFSRFQGGKAPEIAPRRRGREVNHVEAMIVERVARLFPDLFGRLRRFREQNRGFVAPWFNEVARELVFYLRYLDLLDELGLPHAFAEFGDGAGFSLNNVWEMALALDKGGEVVANDVELRPGERALVITGPNQGGKTTLARAIGQVFYLARLGLPVPAAAARLPLLERIFTVFETGESGEAPTSKLEAELMQLRAVLPAADERSLVILNEVFSSTTYADALELAGRVYRRLTGQGATAVWVTFLDELTTLPGAVSMVAEVDPKDPSVRTFRVVRRPADGRAYARSLARKYRLTYDEIKERLS